MSNPPILVSARPNQIGAMADIADGIEVKLDWGHTAELSTERTIATVCDEYGVDSDSIVSVHLPPGMNRRYGMAAASGNVGRITDFTHSAFGDSINPKWLTVHSARRFDYRDQVELLGTITEVTGYPVAVENTPDASHFHAPEELAIFAVLTNRVDRLAQTHLLVDTAHVSENRRSLTVDEDAIESTLGRMDDNLRRIVETEFRNRLKKRTEGHSLSLPDDDPWRAAVATLRLVGGDRVRAIHLNDPVTDGLPDTHRADDGIGTVLDFCQANAVAVVLEPETGDKEKIRSVARWLQNRL